MKVELFPTNLNLIREQFTKVFSLPHSKTDI